MPDPAPNIPLRLAAVSGEMYLLADVFQQAGVKQNIRAAAQSVRDAATAYQHLQSRNHFLEKTMAAVADRLHEYGKRITSLQADVANAKADADKNAAAAAELADLKSKGQVLDAADIAALAEPIPGDTTGTGTPAAAAPATPAVDAAGNPIPPAQPAPAIDPATGQPVAPTA